MIHPRNAESRHAANGRLSETGIPSDNGFSFNGSARESNLRAFCKTAAHLLHEGGGYDLFCNS
jgi:hypothetical protein